MLTTTQIRKAAKASKDARAGRQILIYADGAIGEASGDNDVVCLLGSDGSREYPVLRLSAPVSAKRIAEMLGEVQS